MNDAASILVIMLSVVLIFFLIAAIVLMVALIKVSRQLRNIADDVNVTTSKMRQLTENVAKFSSPVIIGKALVSLFKNNKKG
jgi:predicted PurR-regulated permease PerM